MKRRIEDPDIYDVRSMNEFRYSISRRPLLSTRKRRMSKAALRQRSRRLSYTNTKPTEFTIDSDCSSSSATEQECPIQLGTPPLSPPQFFKMDRPGFGVKRRKTMNRSVFTPQDDIRASASESKSNGDERHTRYRPRDLSFQMELLEAMAFDEDYENALLWSSGDDQSDNEDDVLDGSGIDGAYTMI